MALRDSRSEYERRMHRVLEHIDQHLDEPLDLNALATVAHFSAFHFHRLFGAWMGETLGDYLRRRRLEVAAQRLAAQPRLPVIQVALSVGFGSAEAFTRAFKARFACSPSAWRAQQSRHRVSKRNVDQVDRKPDQAAAIDATDDGTSRDTRAENSMHVKLVDRKPATVAYFRHVGPYGDPIASFWQRTVYPWLVTHDLLDAPRYGISHDDPSITSPQRCRYDACVEVAADFVPTSGAQMTTIPGGKYAMLAFKGTVGEIGAAWNALLRDWLAPSGLQLDARPSFEHYPRGSTYDAKTGVFDCEICIPVAPL